MKTIPNTRELHGSIVLEHGVKWLSRQVDLHMKIYARMTGRKPLAYSHAETLLWDEGMGNLMTIGARAEGTARSKVQDYYVHSHELLVLKPKVPLSSHDTSECWKFYRQVKDAKYQRGNFLTWIAVMKVGWAGWLGVKGSRKNYCYELAARFSDAAGRWAEGKSLDMVSVYDLADNQNYQAMEEGGWG